MEGSHECRNEISYDNDVWELVEAPETSLVIDCKWIFKCKVDERGQIERHKARLVAQGYSQRPGLYYDETFSPVVSFESIRTVLAVAAKKSLKVHQMDVTAAFLNGELNECVYMKQPEGYIEKEKEQMSPRCWNSALDGQLQSMGLTQLKSDPCLHVSAFMEKDPLIVAIYVDDILIAGKSDQQIKVKCDLAHCFNVKDLGELK
uniref:Reverse transcriptase Ty1/copia-type domain-containing protein n=1 Tax=Amphimedon queenslandica TaxID=400682 RepID=A0A1X7VY48_AMPQE